MREVTIDGHIDPAEWAGAKRIVDFRDTQPKTGKPGSQPTEAWVLSTPKGLAVAIRVTQSADIPARVSRPGATRTPWSTGST